MECESLTMLHVSNKSASLYSLWRMPGYKLPAPNVVFALFHVRREYLQQRLWPFEVSSTPARLHKICPALHSDRLRQNLSRAVTLLLSKADY